MQESETALAKLTFNSLAAREVFPDTARGLRLRIERGEVTFRSAQRRGVDVIAIERRARGVTVPVEQGNKRLLDRLYKAGLTEDQPYFSVEPAERGWWGIVHLQASQAPQRHALIRVSDFDPPPVPMDMPLWRRFTRVVGSGRPASDDLWLTIRSMVITALAITARPIRGRQSNERILANKILDQVEKSYEEIAEWAKGQDIADDVMQLLDRVRPEADEPEPFGDEEEDEPRPRRRRTRDPADDPPRQRTSDVSPDYVANVLKSDPDEDRHEERRPVVADEIDEPAPRRSRTSSRRARRRLIDPVILDDDPPEAIRNNPGAMTEVTFAEVFAEIDQSLATDPADEGGDGDLDEVTVEAEPADVEDDDGDPREPTDVTNEIATDPEADPEIDPPVETTAAEPEVHAIERDATYIDPLVELLGPTEEFFSRALGPGEDDEGNEDVEEPEPSSADEVAVEGSPESNEATDAESVIETEEVTEPQTEPQQETGSHEATESHEEPRQEPGSEAESEQASPTSEDQTARERKPGEPRVAGLGDQPDID